MRILWPKSVKALRKAIPRKGMNPAIFQSDCFDIMIEPLFVCLSVIKARSMPSSVRKGALHLKIKKVLTNNVST